jgi:protein CWC15
VVFKNQARGTEEKGKNKEFINVSSLCGWKPAFHGRLTTLQDLLRSDFHKRFMSKYVR